MSDPTATQAGETPRTKPSYRNSHIIVEWDSRWYEIPQTMMHAVRENACLKSALDQYSEDEMLLPIAELRAENERLRRVLALEQGRTIAAVEHQRAADFTAEEAERQLEETRNTLSAALFQLDEAERKVAAAQAKIDALMLEYCPDEMTAEQLEEWGRHQRPVEDVGLLRISPEDIKGPIDALTNGGKNG